MAIDFLVGALRCRHCDAVSPADASTDIQTKLAEVPAMRELGVGAELALSHAHDAGYLALDGPVEPAVLLQGWTCPTCQAPGWVAITVAAGRIESLRPVELDAAALGSAHLILEEDARNHAARATGRPSVELHGAPLIAILHELHPPDPTGL